MNDVSPSDTPYEAARHRQEAAARRLRRRRGRQPTIAASAAPARQAPPVSPSQRQGSLTETRAHRFLQSRGLRILETNLRCRAGEIDLIALEADTLVFVEVRQRTSRAYGGAAASVNRAKQVRLTRTARYLLPYLSRRWFGGRPPACRFDVIALDGTYLTWIRHAFAPAS